MHACRVPLLPAYASCKITCFCCYAHTVSGFCGDDCFSQGLLNFLKLHSDIQLRLIRNVLRFGDKVSWFMNPILRKPWHPGVQLDLGSPSLGWKPHNNQDNRMTLDGTTPKVVLKSLNLLRNPEQFWSSKFQSLWLKRNLTSSLLAFNFCH